MSIRIPDECFDDELCDEYTVFKKPSDFCQVPPAPQEVYRFIGNEVALPFGKWRDFYDEFPEQGTSVCFSSKAEHKVNPRENQVSVFNEAWPRLQKNRCVFLHLSTAVGKTFMGIYLSFKLGKKFIMSTYRTSLFPQWMEEIKKFTTLNVQHIKSSKTKYNPDADGWLVSPTIMKAMPEDIKQQAGTLILDEVHELVTPLRFGVYLTIQPDYLICLTATHDRKDGLESILFMLCGDREEFVDRFTTKEKMRIIKVNTGIIGRYVTNPTTGRLDWKGMVDSIITQQRRVDMVVDLIQKHPDERVMLMAVFNVHFDLIEPALKKAGISFSRMYGKHNEGGDKSTRVLLAQEKKGGVGFDDQTLKVLIFLDTITDVRQKEGRIRGDVPIIYDLVDNTNVHNNHWNIRKEWYAKRMDVPVYTQFYEVIDYGKKPVKKNSILDMIKN